MKTLFMLCGIPGSGKSSLYRSRSSDGYFGDHTLISPDAYLERVYQYAWTPERAAEAWAECYQQLSVTDTNVVWDAVLVSFWDRKKLISLAREYGFDVVAIFLDTPFDVCVARNDLREDRRKVPTEAMNKFNKKLRVPSLDEGITKVEIV